VGTATRVQVADSVAGTVPRAEWEDSIGGRLPGAGSEQVARRSKTVSRVGSPPALRDGQPTLPAPRASRAPSPAAYHRGRVWEPLEGSHVGSRRRRRHKKTTPSRAKGSPGARVPVWPRSQSQPARCNCAVPPASGPIGAFLPSGLPASSEMEFPPSGLPPAPPVPPVPVAPPVLPPKPPKPPVLPELPNCWSRP
jgi:hypothetical protein